MYESLGETLWALSFSWVPGVLHYAYIPSPRAHSVTDTLSRTYDKQSRLTHLLDKLSNSDVHGRVWSYCIIAAAGGNLQRLTMGHDDVRAMSNGNESRAKVLATLTLCLRTNASCLSSNARPTSSSGSP